MNQTVRKFISSAITVTTALGMTGVSLVAQVAHGAQLNSAFAQLSVIRPATTSNHSISFKLATSNTVKAIKLVYSNTASGTTSPAHLDTSAATLTFLAESGGSTGTDHHNAWTLDKSTPGTFLLTNSSGVSGTGGGPTGDQYYITLSGITNNDFDFSSVAKCDAATDSDSCWIQIKTYTSDTTQDSTTLIDQSTVTYTIAKAVTVSATVDPILKFTVSAVNAGSIVANDTFAAQGDATATQTTSTSTSISFGDVTVSKAKLAQQGLQIQTNANNGYNVYQKFIGTDALTGSASATNNIDPFTGTSATWSSPKAWTADPTGTAASVDSGWIGVRTSSNAGVANFNVNDVYGPPVVDGAGAGTTNPGNAVVHSAGPDIGTNVYYVTYKIRVNAFQPADTYTGTSVYNVVASY